MKKHFNELFEIQNGVVSPKVPIQINGITMYPGVSFGGGVSFGVVDLTQFTDKFLEIKLVNDIYVIEGIYK